MHKTLAKHLHTIFRDTTSLGGFHLSTLILLFTLLLQEFTLFLQLLFGIIFTMVAVVGVRIFYFKNRPKKETHHNFIERIDASSFPSLHTARIIFFALAFSYFFKNNLLTIFFIFVAMLVAYSRIYLKKHDQYDVLGGIVLGIITFGLMLLI